MPSEGSILLGEVAAQLATVDISCNFCPRRGTANIGRLYAGAPARHAHTRAAAPAVSRLPETPYGPCRRSHAERTCRSWRMYSGRAIEGTRCGPSSTFALQNS